MNRLDLQSAAQALTGDATVCDDALWLQLGECRLRLRSNSPEHVAQLRAYFSHVAGTPGEPDLDLIAIEREEPALDVAFVDWKREPGKSGRKDAYCDFPGGRLVLKVRTGMVFLQSEGLRIAAGPCRRYDNQVINFVNAQYMNWLQHRDWLICHAAGLVRGDWGLGIAGFSGGGKSTLMLRLLEHDGVAYVTNDRLFVKRDTDGTRMVGIPKLPRINPGTIVHSEKLSGMIEPRQHEELLALPPQELWELEEKYDVHVEQVYGPHSIVQEGPLSAFLVLNWQRQDAAPLRVEAVDVARRRDLLGAIMKSPGPFYQYPDGRFFQDTTELDQSAYLDVLHEVPVFEAQGGVDFEALADFCLHRLTGAGP